MNRRSVCPKILLCLAIFPFLLVLSCSPTESENVPDLAVTNVSALGVRITIPDSVYGNCLWTADNILCEPEQITQVLLSWVDIRVEEWIASRPRVSREMLLSFARDLKVSLVDNWFLVCDPGPGDLCSGVSADGRIGVSIYNFYFSLSQCPDAVPDHLEFSTQELSEISGKDFWLGIPERFGCGFVGEVGIPALVHELDNAID
ncbi:MAG: hypothetical protein ACT4NX_09900 [Deltaproteobacteria bacterium]